MSTAVAGKFAAPIVVVPASVTIIFGRWDSQLINSGALGGTSTAALKLLGSTGKMSIQNSNRCWSDVPTGAAENSAV